MFFVLGVLALIAAPFTPAISLTTVLLLWILSALVD